MIRKAEHDDVPHIVEMAKRFHVATNQPWPLSEGDMADVVHGIIDSGFAVVSDGGFFLGLIMRSPLSRDWIVAKEFLWWAEDGSGMKMFNAFRRWAKDNGADEIQLSCQPSNNRVQAVYGRYGEASEIIYSEVC